MVIVVFGLALAAVVRGQNSTAADNRNTLSWLILYDNFNSSSINPAKWAGLQNYDPDRSANRKLDRFAVKLT
jgi:hypothetical protein